MSYKFDFAFLADRWPDFVAGAWLTIQLTILSIAFGFLLGTVCAVARVYGGPLLRRLVGERRRIGRKELHCERAVVSLRVQDT